MNIMWNFPNNGCGQIRGISDAGIETFENDRIKSLTREICQNSLDAAISEKKCVRVEFFRHIIDTEKLPGRKDYKNKIENAIDFWEKQKNEKTINYLREAKLDIEKSKTKVLRISDYGTTGLSKPYELIGGWNSLTKIDGGATKSGDKAGAFGIGKNAPFCNSNYRLVFYRTLNYDGEIAAQGISRFISFPEDVNDLNTMTTGVGYYGDIRNNSPVESIKVLDEMYARKTVGTDIFIFGFNSDENWKSEVIKEVLRNFLMSIYNNLLIVSVDGEEINKENLTRYISEYGTDMKDVNSYFEVLSNKETKNIERDFHGMGNLKLHVLVDNNKDLNRSVLITRKSGMKLFDKKRISRNISFSSILEMEGTELNKYFRKLENPAHNKWDMKRAYNEKEATYLKKDLYSWIKKEIIELGEYKGREEFVVEGLSGVLQKEVPIGEKEKSLEEVINDIIVIPVPVKKKKYSASIKRNKNNKNIESKNSKKKKTVDGEIDENGEYEGIRVLGGKKKRKKRESHKGNIKEGGRDKVNIDTSFDDDFDGSEIQEIDAIRIIKIKSSTYRVSFYLEDGLKAGYIEIVTVGENGMKNRLDINSAMGKQGCSGIFVKDRKIRFLNMKQRSKIVFEFTLKEDMDYAMEVKIYEY